MFALFCVILEECWLVVNGRIAIVECAANCSHCFIANTCLPGQCHNGTTYEDGSCVGKNAI